MIRWRSVLRSIRAGGDGIVGSDGEIPFWRRPAWWRRAGSASVALALSGAVGFARTVIVARALGPEDFGAVLLAISVATLVTTLLDLSLEEAVVHHGARALTEGKPGRLRGLLRTAMIVDLSVGAIVTFVLLVGAGPVSDLVSRGRLDANLLQLAALSTLPATAMGTTGAALMVAGRADIRAWMLFTTNLMRLLLVAGAVLLFDGPESILIGLVVATAAGAVLEAVVSWRVAWRTWRRDPGPRAPWARTLISFGIHTSLTTTVTGSQQALIATVLGRLAGPVAVGMLAVAKLPIRFARLLSGPVRILLLPEQARLSAEGRTDELRASVRAYVVGALAVGIPAAVVGWFVLPWLIPTLYSSDFAGAVGPARVLLLAALLTLATGWTKPLAAAIGRPAVRTAVTVMNLALVIGLTIVFGHRGADCVAIVLTITNIVTAVAWFVVARRLLGRKPSPVEAGGRPTGRGGR